MKIMIFDNNGITMDRYIVTIKQHTYYMSQYPNRANEVNTYAGKFNRDTTKISKMMKNLGFKQLNKIPKSLKYAIRQRCKEIRHDNAPSTDGAL
jgi:hypothetical protein